MQFEPTTNFDFTIAQALPYGWMCGIPLGNRTSFGYLYNKDITTRQTAKLEIIEHLNKKGYKNPIVEYQFEFKNYFRKENYTDKYSYNGNASFFLEPLEATSLAMVNNINRHTWDLIHKNITVADANKMYYGYLEEIMVVINLHYLNPIHSSDFWDIAKENSQWIYEHEGFKNILKNLDTVDYFVNDFGTWTKESFIQNIEGLSLDL